MILQLMINLLLKEHDRIKNDKIVNKNIRFYKIIINLLIKMERCNFWKNKGKTLLCWQGLVLLDWSWQVRTCQNHDFWSNFSRLGSQTEFLTKFLNDSACFFAGEAQKTCFSIKNPNILSIILKILNKLKD